MTERTTTEGAELTVGASGPMPPEAQQDFTDLVNDVHNQKKRRKGRPKLRLLRTEDVDEVTDAVVASGMAAAEEDIERLDAEYARRETAIQTAPPPPAAVQAKRVAELAQRVRDVVQDARDDGVKFTIRKPEAFPGE